MIARKYFGTDGIRGRFGVDPWMTSRFIEALAVAAARACQLTPSDEVVIGRDTRFSGVILERALIAGLATSGCQVQVMGVLPTAAVSWITRERKAKLGIVISASHNPAEDNGVKFFGSDGAKLSDEQEALIEAKLKIERCPPDLETVPLTDPSLDFSTHGEGFEIYRRVLLRSVPEDFELCGLRLVVDAAHGAAWWITPKVLTELGATVEAIASAPDGHNINREVGSQYPENLVERIRRDPGSIGLAHDGDADRLVLVDEEGTVLDGDDLLAILGVEALQKGRLPGRALVATVMSNLGLDEAIVRRGGRVIRTDVGDRYVLARLLQEGLTLGGEQSGHILLLDHAPTGDGLLTALQILRIVKESGRSLSELRQVMSRYPQRLINFKVLEKKDLNQCPTIADALARARLRLGEQGRVFLRYSGTEPKIRLLIEGREPSILTEVAEELSDAIRWDLGCNEQPNG